MINKLTDIFGDRLQFEERTTNQHNIDAPFGKLQTKICIINIIYA